MIKNFLSRAFESLNYKHIPRRELAELAAPLIVFSLWKTPEQMSPAEISDGWMKMEDLFRRGFDVEWGQDKGQDFTSLFNALRITAHAIRVSNPVQPDVRLRKIDLQMLRRHYKLLGDAAEYLEEGEKTKKANPAFSFRAPDSRRGDNDVDFPHTLIIRDGDGNEDRRTLVGDFTGVTQFYNNPHEDWTLHAANLRKIIPNMKQFFKIHPDIKPASKWRSGSYLNITFD